MRNSGNKGLFSRLVYKLLLEVIMLHRLPRTRVDYTRLQGKIVADAWLPKGEPGTVFFFKEDL